VVDGCRAIELRCVFSPGPSDVDLVSEEIVVDRAFPRRPLEGGHRDHHRSRTRRPSVSVATHMIANVLAASARSIIREFIAGDIRSALRGFRMDHHRTETILERDGVLQ
jgi:UDP-N-acetylmuramoylalanine--D-glutamate ligase